MSEDSKTKQAIDAVARRLGVPPSRARAVPGAGLRAAKPSHVELTAAQRHQVVATFITLIEGLYAHLPQKRAMYGHDPVQRLSLLQQRAARMEDSVFHLSMAEILTDLRDAHTRYIVGGSVGQVAVLPLLVESYEQDGQLHYVVSRTFAQDPTYQTLFQETQFEGGVEITHWNGVPIARAVDLYAERETGGRPDARQARAVESLTVRPLRYALPPDEKWVVISFIRKGGKAAEVRVEWRRLQGLPDLPKSADLTGLAGLPYAGNPAAEAARHIKKMLADPVAWHAAETKSLLTPSQCAKANRNRHDWITGEFQDNAAARIVTTPSGEFGHLRLWSFDLGDDDGFIAEIVELLGHMPRTGLIIDLRGNPGGLIWAAERLLQLFTPNRIEPTRFSMLATDLTRAMAMAPQGRELKRWEQSLNAAVSNGEAYARNLAITPARLCNDRGQHYPGPVLAVVDATTYSSGDLFAAGFADNLVGSIVSLGNATGAGGANVWFPPHVKRALAGTEFAIDDLPPGISYTIAFRRAVRTGDEAGTGIEDVGVQGDYRRSLTKRDLTEDNVDLLAFCGALLASEIPTDMTFGVRGNRLRVTTTGLNVIDLFVDGHPYQSKKLELPRTQGAASESEFELPAIWRSFELAGMVGDNVRQRRRVGP